MEAHAIADTGADPGKPDRPDDIPAFDAAKMRPDRGLLAYLFERLCRNPPCLIWVVRWLGWLARLRNIHFVIRYDQVREAFGHDQHFPVAWGDRMERETAGKDNKANPGKNFVLGMKRDPEYRDRYKELATYFPLEHVQPRVALPAKDITERLLKKAGAEFDAIEMLIHGVPSLLCKTYFGVAVGDEKEFAKWTLAASAYTFAPDEEKEKTNLGLGAAACLRVAINKAIADADPRDLAKRKDDTLTVIEKMVMGGVNQHQIRAQLFGMVLGFVPTDVLAGGNILETLLLRPDFLERASAAALANDDELLWRCLREALRFRNINPFMWRRCPGGHTFADGRRIPPGKKNRVFISNQAAMWDPKRVERRHIFDPYRRDEDYLMFNPGQHWCLGAYIAKVQLTQTFKPLLKLSKLRAVKGDKGKMRRFSGIFPMSLYVTFGEGKQ